MESAIVHLEQSVSAVSNHFQIARFECHSWFTFCSSISCWYSRLLSNNGFTNDIWFSTPVSSSFINCLTSPYEIPRRETITASLVLINLPSMLIINVHPRRRESLKTSIKSTDTIGKSKYQVSRSVTTHLCHTRIPSIRTRKIDAKSNPWNVKVG